MFCYLAISLLILLFLISAYFCLKFALIIIRIQDSLEESIDVLDQKYEIINQICSRPLFYDSQEVRSVLESIRQARDSMITVAKSLTDNFKEEPAEETLEDTNEG